MPEMHLGKEKHTCLVHLALERGGESVCRAYINNIFACLFVCLCVRAYEKERAEGGTEREVGVYLSMFFIRFMPVYVRSF